LEPDLWLGGLVGPVEQGKTAVLDLAVKLEGCYVLAIKMKD